MMRRGHVWKLAIAMAVLGALVAPVIAFATLPNPRQALIVPFERMGKLKLGITKAKAFDVWGPADDCAIGTDGRDTCVWFANSRTDFPVEAGVLELKEGKVCGMYIRAGENFRDGSLSITRLKDWETKEGVGLGSRMRKAKRVLGGTTVKTKNRVTTGFFPATTSESSNKVGRIAIFKQGCNVT
jgi:hypothetical protein